MRYQIVSRLLDDARTLSTGRVGVIRGPARWSSEKWGPVLVGMRGSGKSTLLPLLATKLGLGALDADKELERQSGYSVAAIFKKNGEAYFRQLEETLLLDDLLERRDTVIATGGGALVSSRVRAVLRTRPTIWLRATAASLAQRIHGSDRPSLSGKPIEDELGGLLAEREPFYREVSSIVVETDHRDPAAVVETICRALGSRSDDVI